MEDVVNRIALLQRIQLNEFVSLGFSKVSDELMIPNDPLDQTVFTYSQLRSIFEIAHGENSYVLFFQATHIETNVECRLLILALPHEGISEGTDIRYLGDKASTAIAVLELSDEY